MKRQLLMIGFCFSQLIIAQQIPTKKYTIQDGLINSTIYRLYEQDERLLWFTSAYGVSSYDGQNFKNYTINGSAMTAIGITSFGGTVWISTLNEGIWYFEDETWKKWKSSPQSGNKPRRNEVPVQNENSLRVYQMKADNQGRIWLLDEQSKVSYISPGRELHRINTLPPTRYIHNDGKGHVYFATEKGLYRYSDKGSEQLAQLDVYSIDTDNKGNILLGGKGKFYRLHANGSVDSIMFHENTELRLIKIDRKGKIWCSTPKPSLYRIEGSNVLDLTSQLSLNNTYINDIHIDKEDNIFLATYGAGIHKIAATSIFRYSIESGLSTNIINVIGEDPNGNILAGGFGGLAVYVSGKNSFDKCLKLGINEQVNALKVIGRELWIGTNYNVYRSRGRYLKKIQCSGLSLLEKDDSMLLSVYSGVSVLAKNENKIHSKISGPNDRINAMCRTSDGSVWYAGNSALFREYNGTLNVFLKGLQINSVIASKNTLWISSNQGIYCKRGREWQHYTLNDGLNNLYTTALAFDRKGRLWAGSYNGLHWFDGKRFHLLRHGSDLPSDMILSLYADRKGFLWFGTNNGLYSLNLQDVSFRPAKPEIFVSNLKTSGQADDPLNLSPHFNTLSLSFGSPAYKYPGDIIYEYRINKDEKTGNWVTALGRSLELSSLAHGHYRLDLRARYVGEELSSAIYTQVFRIKEPFWLNWWFVIIFFVSIITGIYLTIRAGLNRTLRKRQLKARHQLKFLKLKQQALDSMIAPHFVFNSLNSVQSFINTSDKRSANKYISDFAALIRLTLDASSGLDVSLEEEVKRIRLYFSLEKMRLGEKMNYTIRIDETLALSQIRIPSLLIQPFLENAIWHGIMPQGGNVDLSISACTGRKIRIIIADDGIGMENSLRIKQDKIHKSLGLTIIKKRLALIGQITQRPLDSSLKFNRALSPDRGTTVEMELPVL